VAWKSAEELRTIAHRLRAFARTVTDFEVLSELRVMIVELERQAREQENGGSSGLRGLAHLRPPHCRAASAGQFA
jgi:hypothetical protein